jgi:hypothetical protein
MKTYEIIILRKRILAGIDLAYKKLVDERSQEDGELVFSKDGKILKVKARELQKNAKDN